MSSAADLLRSGMIATAVPTFAENCSASHRTPVRLHPGMVIGIIPEYRSASSRKRVRLAPEYAVTTNQETLEALMTPEVSDKLARDVAASLVRQGIVDAHATPYSESQEWITPEDFCVWFDGVDSVAWVNWETTESPTWHLSIGEETRDLNIPAYCLDAELVASRIISAR